MIHKKTEPILETELVLIYIEEKPAMYARVEKISADVKPKWWRVKFLMLAVPPQLTTWILDDEQIRGGDFTMGGTPIRIEKVKVPTEEPEAADSESIESKDDSAPKKKSAGGARVLSIKRGSDN